MRNKVYVDFQGINQLNYYLLERFPGTGSCTLHGVRSSRHYRNRLLCTAGSQVFTTLQEPAPVHCMESGLHDTTGTDSCIRHGVRSSRHYRNRLLCTAWSQVFTTLQEPAPMHCRESGLHDTTGIQIPPTARFLDFHVMCVTHMEQMHPVVQEARVAPPVKWLANVHDTIMQEGIGPYVLISCMYLRMTHIERHEE